MDTRHGDETRGSLELIPWDPNNETQSQRLYDQRVACGWACDMVNAWKDLVGNGNRIIYWIVLSDGMADKKKLLEQHLNQFPGEREPLIDTATNNGAASREPSRASFIPIGHIGLDHMSDRNREFGLPESTYWILSLYVSWAVQSGGIGRKAMAKMERIAAGPPFNATVVAIDTTAKAWQTSETGLRALYDSRGMMRPAVIRTNEDWYQHQGYRIIARVDKQYTWEHPLSGEVIAMPGVIQTKDLGQE